MSNKIVVLSGYYQRCKRCGKFLMNDRSWKSISKSINPERISLSFCPQCYESEKERLIQYCSIKSIADEMTLEKKGGNMLRQETEERIEQYVFGLDNCNTDFKQGVLDGLLAILTRKYGELSDYQRLYNVIAQINHRNLPTYDFLIGKLTALCIVPEIRAS